MNFTELPASSWYQSVSVNWASSSSFLWGSSHSGGLTGPSPEAPSSYSSSWALSVSGLSTEARFSVWVPSASCISPPPILHRRSWVYFEESMFPLTVRTVKTQYGWPYGLSLQIILKMNKLWCISKPQQKLFLCSQSCLIQSITLFLYYHHFKHWQSWSVYLHITLYDELQIKNIASENG